MDMKTLFSLMTEKSEKEEGDAIEDKAEFTAKNTQAKKNFTFSYAYLP